MTDIETTVENARAQYHYPPIRTALLPSDADELQLRLADRLHRHRHQHALEVIADLGRVFDAEEAEPAIEALGRLLVHASLLAGCERMAIAPIIALGRELTRDSGVSSELPLKPAAALAGAVLEWRQEPAAVIVCALAMAIAKAIDDCEIVHELKVDPLELFKVAAREVLDGKPVTVVTAPAVQPTQPDKAAQRALAWAELRKASEAVVADEWAIPTDGGAAVGAHPYDREPTAGVGQCRTCGSDDENDGRHIVADDLAEATTPEQRANVEHWYTTPHETLVPKTLKNIAPLVEDIMSSGHEALAAFADLLTATGAEPDAAAAATGLPTFARLIVDDPSSPGDGSGVLELPPGKRYETDAELRERIKASMSPDSGSPEACNDHQK